MGDSPHRRSIFSQGLSRTAFIAYFLGAVVPLMALAFVVERYVLPTMADSRLTVGMVGLVASIAILSLGSFFTLRRTTQQSLERIDRDNRRLGALLATSRSLTGSEHASDIAATAVSCAIDLSGASAAYLLIRGKDSDVPPELFETAGADAEKLFARFSAQLMELAELTIRSGQPALKSGGSGEALGAVAMVPLAGDALSIGALAVVHADPEARFESIQIDAVTTLAGLTSVAMRNADLRDAQRNFFSHMTEILVSALDSHLEYNAGHGNRVAQLAHHIGRELGLEAGRLQNLHFASLLHDVGMLRLDRNLLKNSKACEKHPTIGNRMLGRIRLWKDVAPIIQHHHEWFNGNGYPEGLTGDAVSQESRIIAVCDAFDSMISSTSYQVAVPFHAAVEELENNAGSQFDPEIIAAFLRVVERGEITA